MYRYNQDLFHGYCRWLHQGNVCSISVKYHTSFFGSNFFSLTGLVGKFSIFRKKKMQVVLVHPHYEFFLEIFLPGGDGRTYKKKCNHFLAFLFALKILCWKCCGFHSSCWWSIFAVISMRGEWPLCLWLAACSMFGCTQNKRFLHLVGRGF